MTTNELLKYEAVNTFLDKVMTQIYTEDEAKSITFELLDHILSLTEDYLEAGHIEGIAVSKALYQMGDPAEIGFSFTDYEGLRKRKMLRVGLKLGSVLLIALTFGVIFVQGILASEATDVAREASHSSATPWSLWYLFYFPVLMLSMRSSFQAQYSLNGVSVDRLKISKEPLMVLWPYKKRFPWEYVLFSMFFMPMILIFVIAFIFEGGSPLSVVGFLTAISLSIWLFFHSEKYRIPKYVILEEGLLIKNHLVSWAAIDRYTWIRDYRTAGAMHYRLSIEHVMKQNLAIQNKFNGTFKRHIDVNASQYATLSRIMKEKI